MTSLVVTATDTDVGKTVFSAALVASLDASYWKPVQAGTEGGTDTERVARMSGAPRNRLLSEKYVLTLPASPHISAEHDGVEIDTDALEPPVMDNPLVIEGAGGVMVPMTRKVLQADLFARWGLPVVVCARTALGTINHSLLTLSYLRRRNIPVLGIAFIGEEVPDTQKTIADFSAVKVLGRLPRLEKLDRETLLGAFEENFDRRDFV